AALRVRRAWARPPARRGVPARGAAPAAAGGPPPHRPRAAPAARGGPGAPGRRTPARWASRFREAGTPLAAGGGSSPMPTGSVDVIGSVSELGAPTGTETSNDGFAAAGASPRAADMAARAFAPLPPPLQPQLPPHPPRGSSAAPNMV